MRRIGAELQAHIDRVVEARVRSALEPLLAQATAQAVDVARRELASTLRDGLTRALAQEKSRHRGPPGPR
ncbi:hypothetical protein ABXN37_05365 [Piscinibacter sakaiensis]|uniref:hypothetical protein n=1 Tax=Piscinibacter sakaiensis TaxID=1547922 RepID=UPI0037287636